MTNATYVGAQNQAPSQTVGGKLSGKLARVASYVASQKRASQMGSDGPRRSERPQHLVVVSRRVDF